MKEKIVVSCSGIEKSFGGVKALEDVSMKFFNNKITGIIGGNGAGKTTLFNIITGFEKTSKGKVFLETDSGLKEITNKSCEKLAYYKIVRTFQHIRLFNEYNVYENLLAACFSMKQNINYIEKWMKLLNIYNIKEKSVLSLPYGVKRIVEMARCLCTGADIIFLDEIGAGMTKEEMFEIGDIILNLKNNYNKTFVVIEHNMDFILKICDYLYAMDTGKVLAYGKPQDVLKNKDVLNSIIG